jgi:hypothetical protein
MVLIGLIVFCGIFYSRSLSVRNKFYNEFVNNRQKPTDNKDQINAEKRLNDLKLIANNLEIISKDIELLKT